MAAAMGKGIGVAGVAPGARLYALRVLDATGGGSYSNIIAALQWCVDNHIQVASMSLGGSTSSSSLDLACKNAYNAGVVLVAAAGNSGSSTDTVLWPAHSDGCIAVAATDSNNAWASCSSTGARVGLAAPGSGINPTLPGGG